MKRKSCNWKRGSEKQISCRGKSISNLYFYYSLLNIHSYICSNNRQCIYEIRMNEGPLLWYVSGIRRMIEQNTAFVKHKQFAIKIGRTLIVLFCHKHSTQVGNLLSSERHVSAPVDTVPFALPKGFKKHSP